MISLRYRASSLTRGLKGQIWNVADDEPAPPQDVIAYAAGLLGVEPPPEEPFDGARLSPMAREFYADNKRVSIAKAKAELGFAPAYPNYREGLSRSGGGGRGASLTGVEHRHLRPAQANANRRKPMQIKAAKVLAFAISYFSESGLFNGLRPIQIRKFFARRSPQSKLSLSRSISSAVVQVRRMETYSMNFWFFQLIVTPPGAARLDSPRVLRAARRLLEETARKGPIC